MPYSSYSEASKQWNTALKIVSCQNSSLEHGLFENWDRAQGIGLSGRVYTSHAWVPGFQDHHLQWKVPRWCGRPSPAALKSCCQPDNTELDGLTQQKLPTFIGSSRFIVNGTAEHSEHQSYGRNCNLIAHFYPWMFVNGTVLSYKTLMMIHLHFYRAEEPGIPSKTHKIRSRK